MNPVEFLGKFGIKLEALTVVAYVDGRMIQPTLTYLLEEYARIKIEENNKHNTQTSNELT